MNGWDVTYDHNHWCVSRDQEGPFTHAEALAEAETRNRPTAREIYLEQLSVSPEDMVQSIIIELADVYQRSMMNHASEWDKGYLAGRLAGLREALSVFSEDT